ncbi:MAG: hypothetical protein HYV07_18795 [Deltaproteobacteria bacterium]|nr:hypothetical protein [Deltaproteobacteria bacterium]
MRSLLVGATIVGILFSSNPSWAEENPPISEARYVSAGVVSIVFSLGIGHMVAGEWTSTGWIFTLGETASAAVFGVGLGRGMTTGSEDAATLSLIAVGLTALVGLKVWETYDIWTRPKVESSSQSLALAPAVFPGGGGLAFHARF